MMYVSRNLYKDLADADRRKLNRRRFFADRNAAASRAYKNYQRVDTQDQNFLVYTYGSTCFRLLKSTRANRDELMGLR